MIFSPQSPSRTVCSKCRRSLGVDEVPLEHELRCFLTSRSSAEREKLAYLRAIGLVPRSLASKLLQTPKSPPSLTPAEILENRSFATALSFFPLSSLIGRRILGLPFPDPHGAPLKGAHPSGRARSGVLDEDGPRTRTRARFASDHVAGTSGQSESSSKRKISESQILPQKCNNKSELCKRKRICQSPLFAQKSTMTMATKMDQPETRTRQLFAATKCTQSESSKRRCLASEASRWSKIDSQMDSPLPPWEEYCNPERALLLHQAPPAKTPFFPIVYRPRRIVTHYHELKLSKRERREYVEREIYGGLDAQSYEMYKQLKPIVVGLPKYIIFAQIII